MKTVACDMTFDFVTHCTDFKLPDLYHLLLPSTSCSFITSPSQLFQAMKIVGICNYKNSTDHFNPQLYPWIAHVSYCCTRMSFYYIPEAFIVYVTCPNKHHHGQ